MATKTLLEIGAGPGISQSTVERFTKEGFRVVLAARNTDKLADFVGQLESNGVDVHTYQVDVGNADEVKRLIETVEDKNGPIDVLHYNAASMRNQGLMDQPYDTFNSDLAVNVGGAQVAVQTVASKMFERGAGKILLTGGGFALSPHPEFLSLSVGKAGIRALTQGVFDGFKEKGVHISTVTIATFVDPGSKEASDIAEHFWQLYSQPKDQWDWEIQYSG